MATMQTDIVGQVKRLPLKPTENNALLPMYEAISNSLHAITERFGDDGFAKQGSIEIEVLRSDEEGESFVTGFEIRDNGVGLNQQNMISFLKPYSQHKIDRGGKGVGRLSWLKVFKEVSVESSYFHEEKVHHHAFDFLLRDEDQLDDIEPTGKTNGQVGTVVLMREFSPLYGGKCPVKLDTIVQRIIGHFIPIFAGEKSPKMVLIDNDETVDLREVFRQKIRHQEDTMIDVEVDGETQPILIRHMKCDKSIRPRGGANNWLCFCADDRGVKEFGIDEQIGLKSLDGEQIYIGTVTGDYLDTHVNPQRTDFIFDADEGKQIRRQAADSVKNYLGDYIERELAANELAAKKQKTLNLTVKHPQYMYLRRDLDGFIEGLQANSTSEEKIYVEMAQHRFRRECRLNGVRRDIEVAAIYDEQIAEKVAEYQEYVADDNKGSLAEYVMRRKAVLDLLDKLRGFSDPGAERHELEEAAHQLICPMRVTSDELTVDDHNLWILDDRLAFFNFFASDKTLKSFTDLDATKEPDVALIYDNCLAWRESDRSCDTVILASLNARDWKLTPTRMILLCS